MAINFPTWVTNGTAIPGAYLVPAKKALYTFAACEYARLLHNAAYKWHRGATESVPDPRTGEVLSATEVVLLQDAFPVQWAVYPGVWPEPPTKVAVEAYRDSIWDTRHHAAQDMRSFLRGAASSMDLTWVDWQGMV